MTVLVPIVMFGWIPLVIVMFALLPQRHAVVVAFLTAWMFLPEATYDIHGLPDYTKMSATCVGILLSTILFHWNSFRQLRLRWTDLPMIAWCLVPLGSSLSNGLGAYDGVSASLSATVTWGFPYIIGRVHFNDAAGLRFLAQSLLVGGLVYVPFCLWEIKMSPHLNLQVYGFRAGPFRDTIRFGGYRPEVFMKSGLMVAMWMGTTTLVGIWLWATRTMTHLGTWRIGIPVTILLATVILCRSTGVVVLLCMGLLVLFGTRRLRTPLLVVALALVPPCYAAVRGLGFWSGDSLADLASVVSEDRADSLRTRLTNEDRLVSRAAERPMLGWGGYGRNRVFDEETGDDLSITDGLWVIALGTNGIIGLSTLMCSCALPSLLFLRRIPVIMWSDPRYAGAAAIAVCLLLYQVDNILNGMVNPVFMLCAGGLVSLHAGARPLYASVATRASSTFRPAVRVP